MGLVLVTGASRGIGLATCVSLARAGHQVVGTMRNPEGAPELARIAEAESLPIAVASLDVNSDESVRDGVSRILDERGPLDALVNNAGIVDNVASIRKMPHDAWEREVAVNLSGSWTWLNSVP